MRSCVSTAGLIAGTQDMEVTVIIACWQAGWNSHISGRPTMARGAGRVISCVQGPCQRELICVFIGAEVSLGSVVGCRLQGSICGEIH